MYKEDSKYIIYCYYSRYYILNSYDINRKMPHIKSYILKEKYSIKRHESKNLVDF